MPTPTATPADPLRVVTADTAIVLRIEGETFDTTLGLMQTDDGIAEDFPAIKAALERGETYRGGGGAAPIFEIEAAAA